MAVVTTVTTSSLEFSNRIDAELYRPSLRKSFEEIFKTGFAITQLGRVCTVRSGTTPSDRRDSLKTGPILFKTTDIRNGVISPNGDYYRITDEIHHRMAKTKLEERDVLLNIVGATLEVIGRSAFVVGLRDEANITQAMVLLRSRTPEVLPGYLFAYLNTKFGQDQIARFARPTGQYNLNLHEVGHICIPLLPEYEQQAIEKLILSAAELQEASTGSYATALKLLEMELGLNKMTFQKPVGYTTRFSELGASRRADAEFFHVGYESFILAAKNYSQGWSPLGNLSSRTLPNFDARKHSGNFDYIEIGDVNIGNGAYTTTKVNAKVLPANAKIELSGGEILFSQVRPTRGAIAIANEELDHATVCSGAFYVCKVNDDRYREIIWLYLRSIRNVFEKYCGGTSYPTIDSRYIAKFPVPLFVEDLAHRVRELVVESKNAKRKSDERLGQAKARVEQLIAEAVQP